MSISEHDAVRVIAEVPLERVDLTVSQILPRIGDFGTVVLVHSKTMHKVQVFTVECVGDDGRTIWLADLLSSELERFCPTAKDYEQIDPTIMEWVSRNRFTLFTHTEGFDWQYRSVYLSSVGGECCQIWIDPPTPEGVGVHAAAVETRDDEKMRQDWTAELQGLAGVLDEAVLYVRNWFQRPIS